MDEEESTGLPAVENEPAPEPEVEADEPATEGEGEETTEEEVEYDLGGGQKLKVSANATAKEVFEAAQKAFKDVEGNLTRKSQTVAEQAKSIEARAAALDKLSTLNDQVLDEFSRGRAVQRELEQLQKVDINALWQSQPDRARRVSDMISQKQAQLAGIVQNVNKIEGELSQGQVAETARRLEEGAREVERRIPGFAAKHASEVMEYAVSKGVPKEDAGRWAANPVVTEMAHKAMLFDRLQAKAKQAAKPAPTEAQAITTSKLKGGARQALDLNKDANRMTSEEWLKRRKQQLRA